MKQTFINAGDAFEYLYEYIHIHGIEFQDTRAIFNVGVNILDPSNNIIRAPYRKFSESYAEAEFRWYMDSYFNKNPSGVEIAKRAPIWLNHLDAEGNLRSNYGWQWSRNDQIRYVVDELNRDPQSRRAVLTMYDGKEHDTYESDTPCTTAVQFHLLDIGLCMTVTMRSNDLWFGFCNDTYAFSKLQKFVADLLHVKVGWYHHFAANLHLYNKNLNLNEYGTRR